MFSIRINPKNKQPKFQQIAHSFIRNIEKGVLEKDFLLPSINEFSEKYSVARDTVERAYRLLKDQGYITSVAGRGYFVAGKKDQKLKVLLLFNKLSSYKKIVYDSFLESLGDKATVELQIHHYNPQLFRDIIESHLGRYHYYVIMPHFFHQAEINQYLPVLKKIPANELVLLDRHVPGLEAGHMAVYQDFRHDIDGALESALDLFEKYDRLVLLFPQHSNHPVEIIEGIGDFCSRHQKAFTVTDGAAKVALEARTAYIAIKEADLAVLVKAIRKSSLALGKEVGIISFNETVLKELLDITVVTTDFAGMGCSAAQLILNRQFEEKKNPFYMIRRHSL
ncbi:GntR family transcriptional regulator [Paraflavisolibacter sp. H34]|uniref:GntR family transcriptional regulator n=1 Tax=Huijunlia imazamoxiresistens TaxID=3127457 RepID=UPI003018ED85